MGNIVGKMRSGSGTLLDQAAAASRRPLALYGLVVVVIGVTTAIRAAIHPFWGFGIPFATYYVAVLACAWLGGLGPGLVATALSAVLSFLLWMPPVAPSIQGGLAHLFAELVFVGGGVGISFLCAAVHRARARLEERAAELQRVAEHLQVAQQAAGADVWDRDLAAGSHDGSAHDGALQELLEAVAPTYEGKRVSLHPDDRGPAQDPRSRTCPSAFRRSSPSRCAQRASQRSRVRQSSAPRL